MNVIKTLYVVGVCGILAMLIVWHSNEVRQERYRLVELRTEMGRQHAARSLYRAQLSKLKAPGRIVHLIAELNLSLVHDTGAPRWEEDEVPGPVNPLSDYFAERSSESRRRSQN